MTHNVNDIRASILSLSALDIGGDVPGANEADDYIGRAIDKLKDAYYCVQAANWRLSQGKEVDEEVPFNDEDGKMMDIPLDTDGWFKPKLPELVSGHWYKHGLKSKPTGPAAFLDADTKVEWHSTENGLEDMPKTIKDIDWSKCRMYRKYEPIDEVIADFGIF